MNPADLPPQLHLDGALRGDALLAAKQGTPVTDPLK